MELNWLEKVAQNVPKAFRVSIDFDENIAQQLANQQLEGISGISDSQINAMQWFNVAREGMLMMSGPETIAMNNLSQIAYGDTDQMMQNNMALMLRIFNQRKPADVIQRLFNYVAAIAKKANDKRFANIAYFMEYTAFWQHLSYSREAEDIQVNSVGDLVAWAMQVAPTVAQEKQGDWGQKMMTLPASDWEYLINEAVLAVGNVYSDEGEWTVEDKVLKVPSGSTLYIMLPEISDEQRADWEDPQQRRMMEFMGTGASFAKIEDRKRIVSQYGLDRLYRIRFVGDKSLDEQKRQYYQKMDRQRDQQNDASSSGIA